MASGSERRLAAIMFTDIVGYTALHAASPALFIDTTCGVG